jgi:hypothetical protein
VELYPHALAVESNLGNLPLHELLWNKSSTIDDALLMIEKYPESLQHVTGVPGITEELALHIECESQCRLAIISKFIELYPDSLAIANGTGGYLPLHKLLMNESSSIDMALMMIKKYPVALQQRDYKDRLPLHVK